MSTMHYNERAYFFLSDEEKAELAEAHKKGQVSVLFAANFWLEVHRSHTPDWNTAVYRIHKPRLYQD